jgi:two-component system, sensor histidine kinase and response regulator
VIGPTRSERPPHLVLRFAIYSALALAIAGLGMLVFVRHEAQLQAERELTADANRAAASVAVRLQSSDLVAPVEDSRQLAALDALFEPELMDNVIRVKLWRPDGTVVYSTDHTLIGHRIAEAEEELQGVLAGKPIREVGHLNDEGGSGENVKVISAYVPLHLEGDVKPRAVLEFYNDYGPIAAQAGATVKPVAIALALALVLLFASLFPILSQVTKVLEQRSKRLEKQANELERTLSERRQAVASLRDAETRYRALIEQLPLVTYVSAIDKPGFSSYVSPQIERLLGYTPEEWLATPSLFWRVVHDDDAERVRVEHRQGYAEGRPFSSQYRLVTRDGRVVWVEDQVIVVNDADGTPVQAQGFLLDITHRKAAERALADSEERFRTLVGNVPGVIFRCEIDSDWTMEYLSDEIEDLVGYPSRAFIRRERAFGDLVHAEDRKQLEEDVAAAVAEERPYTTQYRVVHADGSIRHVVERGKAILTGGERKLDGAIFDVTEQRTAEAERLKLASIVESSQDSIISTDLGDIITSWNDGATRIYGYSSAEMIGRSFSHLVPDDLHDERPALLERVLAGDAVRSLETRRQRRNGSLVDVLVSISPIRDSAGKIVGVATIAQDISTRKQVEAERERLLHELEAQNERLRELDRLKDEFVALVSHELRTPLTSIRGYLELVLEEEGALTDEQRQFLGVVERNAHRLLALVGDLLFLAQIEAGKLSLEVGAVDLSAIAAESVETARPLAEEKDITVTLATGPLALIAGDRARLAQLLDNLVSNGIKFTPPGGRVDVRVRGERGQAVIEVRDTGMGISSEEQEHLFERFFRTAKATEQAIPGTGLGLAISKAIVHAHGGRITFASSEGSGTTFRVSIPVRQLAPEPLQAEEVAL